MTMTMNNKKVPEDVNEIFSFLMGMRNECSDLFACQFKELFNECKDDIAHWKKDNGDEPDWDYYRRCLNDLCRDDGMPILFEGV